MQITRLGPYRIGALLGRGGMGSVYEGVEESSGIAAAIKVLSASLAHHEGFRDRFDAEIESLRKLRHPHIVRLLGFGEQDGLLFYAMELVKGKSLEQELKTGRFFSNTEVLEIGIQVCRALKHAHDHGIIHRDLKPANLLCDETGVIKLSDFGIAKLFSGGNLTNTGGILGTAEYMSPEQAEGKGITNRSDLYSLGCVLFSLASRRPPFRANSLVEMLQMQRYAEPKLLRQVAPDVPQELEVIVNQLLQKNPQDRPANATIIIRRLETILKQGNSILPSISGLGKVDEESSEKKHPQDSSTVISAGNSLASSPRDEESNETLVSPMPSASDSDADFSLNMFPVRDPENSVDSATLDSSDASESDQGYSLAVSPLVSEPRSVSPPTGFQETAPGTFQPVPEDSSATFSPAEVTISSTSTGTAHFTPVDPTERFPLYREEKKSWLPSWQTWVLAASLLIIGGGTWYMLQGASADDLYDQVMEVSRLGKIEDLGDMESEIQEFLNRFPQDPRAEKMHQLQEEVDLYRLERKFELQARRWNQSNAWTPAERAYFEAVNYLRLDPDLGIQKLDALIALHGAEKADPATEQCLELARRQLERLKRQSDFYTEDQVSLIERKIQQAHDLKAEQPEKADTILHALLILYGDKPWAQAILEPIREELALPPSPVLVLPPSEAKDVPVSSQSKATEGEPLESKTSSPE